MSDPQMAPYGSWRSPITPDLIASESIGLGSIKVDGADLYWLESRPSEAGRLAIVRCAPDGTISEALPLPFNARTRVHEYGGGAYLLHEGTIYFSNFADQRLYRLRPGEPPEPLTPEAALRYADGVMDSRRQRILCVREDHRVTGQEATNTLVALSLAGNDEAQVLVSGNDFYSSPRLSPDGQWLTWLTWNHPHMPWDASELWLAKIDADGSLKNAQRIAGGEGEAIVQPEWSPEGTLYFVSDQSGWSNLYRWRDGQAEQLLVMEAETGPLPWNFGGSTYAFASEQHLVFAYVRQGTWALASLDTQGGAMEPIETPYTDFWSLHTIGNHLFFVAGSPTEPPAIVQLDLESGQCTVLRRSMSVHVDPGYFAAPQPIEFPTENGLTAYGFFYPPTNHHFVAPAGERPPLLVMSHGGPTAAVSNTLDLGIQYWTSRGIAVLDVNYGG
ncbi:MAG: PD40 domain-containing protein, partial [Ardenticatenales bacterium]|nr:PD40 domain-containing protein [Ardenticatenales bacterium]